MSTIGYVFAPSVVRGTINAKENTVWETSSNNLKYTLGADFDFYRVQLNSTVAWFDKTFTEGYYTRYCLYCLDPSNVNLTMNTWFTSTTGTARLTITVPTSTNISMGFYSPNLITASVLGAVTSTWNSGNQTLNFVVNTDTSVDFVLNAEASETLEDNILPENYAVSIADIGGCAGNWVYSGLTYYDFEAQYWDGNGYETLDTMRIAFSDGYHWVNASYDGTYYLLESGEGYARLRVGSTTVLDSNLLQVTFPILLTEDIQDALNVDIYMWCNDTQGGVDGWEIMEADYFNIYNVGGHVESEFTGNAGKLDGGDWCNLYAERNSTAYSSIIFHNLKYVDAIFGLDTYGNLSEDESDDMNQQGLFSFGLDYCVDDIWHTGPYVNLMLMDIDRGGGWPISTPANWAIYQNDWVYMGVPYDKRDYLVMWYEGVETTDYRDTQRIHVRFWFNKANASTTIGGWISPVFYGWTPSGNWVLTGSAGPKRDANPISNETAKDSFFFDDLYPNNRTTIIPSTSIEMVRFWVRVLRYDSEGYVYSIKVVEMLNFIVGTDMYGVDTPAPIEPTLPTEAQGGGIFAWLGNLISGLMKTVSEAFGPVILGFWNTFVGFLDTIAGWLGIPNGFSNLLTWLGSLWTMTTDGFGYLLSMLTPIFSFFTTTMSKFVTVFTLVLTQWVGMAQIFINFLDGAYTAGINVYTDLGVQQWIILGAILYPMYLIFLWDEKGLDAVLNQLSFLYNVINTLIHFLISIAQITINIIGRIIESIPVVE